MRLTREDPDEKVAKLSISTYIFLGSSVLFAGVYWFTRSPVYPLSVIAFIASLSLAWLGGIQILNRAANSFPPQIARLIHWIHAMTFECFAILGIAFAHSARFFRSYGQPAGPSQGRPILLVHGYFNDSSVWIYQKAQLQNAGLGPIYTIDLGNPFRSIRDYALQINEKAREIERETGREDLILIGYSMGGLVSSWYATRIAPIGKVTDVITIGSPLSGTPVARIGFGPNAREMQRDSDLVKKIQAEIAGSQQIRFYHIGSKSDQLVIPGESAVLLGEKPERQFIIEDVGHAGLIYSRRVSQKICHWLQRVSKN